MKKFRKFNSQFSNHYSLITRKAKGFTLIELLVVIAVLSGLATVLVFLINPAEINRKSRDSKRYSHMNILKSAVDLSLADGQKLPDTTGYGYIVLNSASTVSDIDPDAGNIFDLSKYTSNIPEDPYYAASGTTKGVVLDGSGNCVSGTINKADLQYRMWSDGSTYILRSLMESESNCSAVTKDGNNNASFELGTEPGLDAF